MRIESREILELLRQVPLFAHLDVEVLNDLVGCFRPEAFNKESVIFDINDSSETFYLVFDGQINLQIIDANEPLTFATLRRGDFFGEEALLSGEPRLYRAVASANSILLRLNIKDFLERCDQFPELQDYLDVSVRSRRLSVSVSLPWLNEDEVVYVITRRHPAILWARLFIPFVFIFSLAFLSLMLQFVWFPEQSLGWITAAIAMPLNLGWLIWTYFDWRNDYFLVTNKRVVWIEKVALIYDSRQEAPLNTIMSVGVQASRMGTLIGFADVVVRTYVGTIRLQDLKHADAIAKMIEAYWQRSKSLNQREESRAMEKKLREKLNLPVEDDGAEDEEKPTEGETPHTARDDAREPGFLRWLLSDFMRLRYEEDQSITYRKHWFILLKTTGVPFLFFALGVAAFIGRVGGALSFISMGTFLVIDLIYLLVFFIWLLYNYVDWRNDIFKVTLEQIIDIDKKPLGKINRRSAPLENVLSIEYERLGFWGLIFNFGTVYISVGNTKFTFDYVYNPSEVQQDIFYRMGERIEQKRQFELESQRDRISDWIVSYHRKSDELRRLEEKHPRDDENDPWYDS